MAPQSRGRQIPPGFQSKSTPNLPTLRSLGPHQHEEHPIVAPSPSTSHPVTCTHSPASNSALSAALWVGANKDEDGGSLAPNEFESSASEEDEEGEHNAPTSRPLYTSRSHSHLPRQTASALFPPFYNRPPTPLPPSPSLTSLLRPSFSAANSRWSTPESSDVDVPTGPASVTNGASTPATSTTNLANSARHAPTVPRASPKVPTYEYYGFALYLGSSAAFLMYILWAYVPAPLLHQMGIHYYPNRWWALAVPCWLAVLVMYIYVALASYNTRYLTLPLNSCENVVDECAQMAVVDSRTGKIVRDPLLVTDKGTGAGAGVSRPRRTSFSAYQFGVADDVDWSSLWSTGTDAVMDVPIGGVCELLYGSGE
jgi:phosphatidylinositol glycan class P protein